MRHHRVVLSMTEVGHFRRLVDFLQEVEDYGRVTADEDLLELVETTRADLASIGTREGDGS